MRAIQQYSGVIPCKIQLLLPWIFLLIAVYDSLESRFFLFLISCFKSCQTLGANCRMPGTIGEFLRGPLAFAASLQKLAVGMVLLISSTLSGKLWYL